MVLPGILALHFVRIDGFHGGYRWRMPGPTDDRFFQLLSAQVGHAGYPWNKMISEEKEHVNVTCQFCWSNVCIQLTIMLWLLLLLFFSDIFSRPQRNLFGGSCWLSWSIVVMGHDYTILPGGLERHSWGTVSFQGDGHRVTEIHVIIDSMIMYLN